MIRLEGGTNIISGASFIDHGSQQMHALLNRGEDGCKRCKFYRPITQWGKATTMKYWTGLSTLNQNIVSIL